MSRTRQNQRWKRKKPTLENPKTYVGNSRFLGRVWRRQMAALPFPIPRSPCACQRAVRMRGKRLATGAVPPEPHFADTTRRDFDARAWHSPVTVGRQNHVGSAKCLSCDTTPSARRQLKAHWQSAERQKVAGSSIDSCASFRRASVEPRLLLFAALTTLPSPCFPTWKRRRLSRSFPRRRLRSALVLASPWH